MTWTDARIAQISRLWAQGLSANDIAEALGDVSRSAVLGKLHRLKLLRSRKAASAPRRFTALAAPSGEEACALGLGLRGAGRAGPPQPPRSPWRETAFAPLMGTAPRPWLSRDAGECAFPVGGDGEQLLSCCAPTTKRSAYCACHHRIVFRPGGPVTLPAEPKPTSDAAIETNMFNRSAA